MDFVDNYVPAPEYDSGYGGGVADMVMERNFAALRRPYFDKNGRPAVTINRGRYTTEKGVRVPIREHVLVRDLEKYGIQSPVANATALRKEEWIEMERKVLPAARFRMKAWSDLAKNNPYSGFNGMGKMLLEHETMSDPGEAIIDMDGLTPGRNDAPQFQLQGLPLTITHSDFFISQRKLSQSRNTGTPIDSSMGEASGRRVGESVEKVTIGVDTGPSYGGNSTQVGGYGRTASVYGYTNFSARLLKTNLASPVAAGWTPAKTLADVLAMRDKLFLNKFYGPFMLYTSNDWDQYMDGDYILTGGNVATQTLRERLKGIDGIQDIRRLDFLTAAATAAGDPAAITTTHPFTLIMVQMTSDVARAVIGMDVTVLQWESKGGMQINFKTMCIMVPQLRADFYNNCGILHATTS